MSILFYKRPDYIALEDGPLSQSNCQKYVERACNVKDSIPAELSFENIIEGRTLPVCPSIPLTLVAMWLTSFRQPCSLEDFLDYLVYITHDAENLQFYLWLRDYTKRFNALPKSERALSPEWTVAEAAPDLRAAGPGRDRKASNFSVDMTAFYDDKPDAADEFRSVRPPPPTARTKKQAAAAVAEANAQAGLHWESCTSPLTPTRASIPLPFSHDHF